MNAILHEDPPTLSSGPQVSPAIDRLVRRCLEKEKEQRFQSSHDLAYALEAVHDASGAMPTLDTTTSHGPERSNTLLRVIVASLLALAIGLWVGRTLLSSAGTEPVTTAGAGSLPNARIIPLTFESGVESQPSLSPDGRSFVYTARDGGDWDIFRQRVGGENRINLTPDSPGADRSPKFSFDGEKIVFSSERDGGGIFVMGATGESVRRLTDFGYNPAWSPDGQTIVFGTANINTPLARNSRSALWIANARTGVTTKIYDGDGVEPSWSPDGTRIAFWGLPTGTGKRILYTIPAEGGEPQALNDDDFFNWNPTWSADGRTLYFSSTRNGTMDLWRLPMDPATGRAAAIPQPLTASTEWVSSPSVARDGSRILYVASRSQSVIGRLPFDTSNPDTARVLAPEVIFRTSRAIWMARPSPDGRWLVLKTSDPDEDLFICESNGSGLRRLTQDVFKDRQPRWSPDSRTIYFFSDRSGRYEVFSIRPDGSGLTQLTELTGPSAGTPVPSPDGTRLLVLSTRQGSGIVDLTGSIPVREVAWVAPPDSSDLFASFKWFPDGNSILGNAGWAGAALRYSLLDQTYEEVADVNTFAPWFDPGHSVLMHVGDRFVVRDIQTGEDQVMFRVPDGWNGRYEPSADRRWIYTLEQQREADIWMLEFPNADAAP